MSSTLLPSTMATATSTATLFSSSTHHRSSFLTHSPKSLRLSFTNKRRSPTSIKAELNPQIVISLSTGLSLFLGRFVFFNFQRENVAKQGLPKQNGISHFEAGDARAREYAGLLKSNDPVGFNIVDVLAWGSLGHIVAYYILATSSNGYDPSFFGGQ
ncbi:hypothetical protein KFK09_012566 [Dendrobium nobile]|uniref:Photosystem I reaction center subunit V, chloroplastic n=1 Tax=Dendrobium nobile TaxID=94219 RepID=A0A8T3BFU4_DENNO|nr:hypothetical protein KFK09_012566 [Dendrobium nobile]